MTYLDSPGALIERMREEMRAGDYAAARTCALAAIAESLAALVEGSRQNDQNPAASTTTHGGTHNA